MKTEMNELVYNKEQMEFARNLMEEIKKELYDIDCLLYDAVMKVAYANGIEQVEYDNKTIDLRLPETYMIQCREDTKMISDTLNEKIVMIEDYNQIHQQNSSQSKQTSTVTDQKDKDIQAGLTGVVAAATVGLVTGLASSAADQKMKKELEIEEEKEEK